MTYLQVNKPISFLGIPGSFLAGSHEERDVKRYLGKVIKKYII